MEGMAEGARAEVVPDGQKPCGNHHKYKGILCVKDKAGNYWYESNQVTSTLECSMKFIKRNAAEEDLTLFSQIVREKCNCVDVSSLHGNISFISAQGLMKICARTERGVVYCITTDQYEKKGLYKIGYTADFDKRLSSINATRMDDDEYHLVHKEECDDPYAVEKLIHKHLSGYRKNLKKELFECSEEIILKSFDICLQKHLEDEKEKQPLKTNNYTKLRVYFHCFLQIFINKITTADIHNFLSWWFNWTKSKNTVE